jgi:hypothetical protein
LVDSFVNAIYLFDHNFAIHDNFVITYGANWSLDKTEVLRYANRVNYTVASCGITSWNRPKGGVFDPNRIKVYA